MAELYFYDADDEHIAQEARNQGEGEANLVLRGITSYRQALNILDGFIRQRRRFQGIYFNTHGSPGEVYLPNGSLTTGNVHELSSRRAVLEDDARVLFMGCSVADTNAGWRFLDAVGRTFLSNGFVGGANVSTFGGRGGLFEARLPKWGLLRIVQVRAGQVVRHSEYGTLLARFIRWLRE